MGSSGQRISVRGNDGNPVSKSAQDHLNDIRAAFEKIKQMTDSNKRAKAARRFVVDGNFKPYIYMNPIEAPWFYKTNENTGQ